MRFIVIGCSLEGNGCKCYIIIASPSQSVVISVCRFGYRSYILSGDDGFFMGVEQFENRR